MNFFYGVYPAEKKIARLFDLSRLILQPDYARKAHITLRGPYEKRPSRKSKWLGLQLHNAILSKPATFFNDWQNTVYLRAELIEAKDVSWKKDFQDSIPHMSIYDGNNRNIAWQVLLCLRKFPWNISIELTPVLVLERKKDYEKSFFLEIDDIDIAFDYIAERSLSRDYIKSMHDGQRIYYLEKICRAIHEINSST